MAQYMFLIRDDIQAYSRYSREELTALIGRMGEWSQKLKKAGVHRGAEKLTDEAPRVLRRRQGELVLDGPFAEAKELIGGFFVVEARDEAEAIEIAKECPALQYASEIELRTVAESCQVVVERGH